MRKLQFESNCYYHIYNRGVDSRKIFMDENDYKHFIKLLYLFNHSRHVVFRELSSPEAKPMETIGLASGDESSIPFIPMQDLVDIGAYCLMPNHWHIFIKTNDNEKGLTLFMSKVCTGYAMYFNKKYKRTGRLFENTFKASLIESDEYLRHISLYIHTNPIKLIEPKWKEDKIKDIHRVNDFIEKYPWSSYPQYLGKREDLILNLEVFPKYFDSGEKYKKNLNDWVLNYDYSKRMI